MNTLITGGLGYVGSHIAANLKDKAIIIDNRSNSKLNFKKNLPNCKVYIGDLNQQNLNKIFKNHKIDKVIHMASLKSVNESIIQPLKYYENNIFSTISLLRSMDQFNINKLVFSSSATVYGGSHQSPLKENMHLESTNPYGSTKIIIENLISDFSKYKKNFKAISLRYFNPIGSNIRYNLPEQPLGTPQNIMPVLINSIQNKRTFQIFGKNYNTKDGTCIRDYIHVQDLADAHIKSLNSFKKINGHEIFNIGSGRGYSVLELVRTFESVNNIKVKIIFSKRRNGDSAVSYSSIKKAKKILNWSPKFNLRKMCQDSWIAAQS